MKNEPEIVTPGDTVRYAMEQKNWTQSDLAYALGTTKASVNQILNNRRGISHNMARSLGIALDYDPKIFARVQAEWDVVIASEPDPIVSARSRILSKYPLREMVKRGWIDPERGRGSLEEQACHFFSVTSLDEIPHITHSAKKTGYEDTPPNQLAWLFRVKEIASEMTTPAFSRAKFNAAVKTFCELRHDPAGVRRVPRLLEEAGVRFVVVEGLPKGLIDGVCFWLDKKSPVIGMSLRYDRIDNFWFVLRHECAHVRHGHGKTNYIIDCDLNGDISASVNEEEKIANEEAAEFCVPSKKMQSFYTRKYPYFTEREVLAFSKRVNVHPGLVVGQIQRRMDRYNILRQHLVKVREHLGSAMMMDGWGDLVPTGH